MATLISKEYALTKRACKFLKRLRLKRLYASVSLMVVNMRC